MNYEKKFSVFMLMFMTFLFCFYAQGCKSHFYYDYDELMTNVETVELINIIDGRKDVLKVLSEEEMKEFFQDLSNFRYTYVFGDKPSIGGIAVKLYYRNGKTEIFNWRSGMAEGNQYLFNQMLEKYLDETE